MEKIKFLKAGSVRFSQRREEAFSPVRPIAYLRVPKSKPSRRSVAFGAAKVVIANAGVKFMDLLERGNRNINRKHPKGIDTDFVFGKGGLRRW